MENVEIIDSLSPTLLIKRVCCFLQSLPFGATSLFMMLTCPRVQKKSRNRIFTIPGQCPFGVNTRKGGTAVAHHPTRSMQIHKRHYSASTSDSTFQNEMSTIASIVYRKMTWNQFGIFIMEIAF